MKSTNAYQFTQITVKDPDTGAEVKLDVYKTQGGGVVAIDSSFIATEEPVYSPFDKGTELNIVE